MVVTGVPWASTVYILRIIPASFGPEMVTGFASLYFAPSISTSCMG